MTLKRECFFNPEESVDLNGNTGPFIQYAHARISSLLRKAENLTSIDANIEMDNSERELIKHLVEFPITIEQAGDEYSPALIANYTFELVKKYNSFYQSVSIFKEEDEAKKNMRLQMSAKVAEVIKSAMSLLGIQVPDRM